MKKIGIIGVFLGITLIVISLVIFMNGRSSSLKNTSSNKMKVVDRSKAITDSMELEKYKFNIELSLKVVSEGEKISLNDLKFLEIDESGYYVVLSKDEKIRYLVNINDNTYTIVRKHTVVGVDS